MKQTLLKFSFAFRAFKLLHVDSAEKADTELAVRAIPVSACYPLAA